MNQEKKLERFAEREIAKNIDNIIISDDEGGYIVFGRYQIQPTKNGFTVNTWDKPIHCFASKRNAISYCVADKTKNYNLARNILVLDRKKQMLAADIHCRLSIATRSRAEDFAELVNTKIQPKITQHDSVSAELEKCVNSAKYIQIRGFNNETARTSGP